MTHLAPLRHAPYRQLIAGRTITVFGNAFAPIALAFAVLDLTGSAADLGLVVGARTIANIVFLLAGGVLADRFPRHRLMVGASLAAAATQAAVAATVLTGTATIAVLVILSVLNGVVSAIALPASSALLPATIPADIRQQGNALSRLSFNSAALIGAPLAGIVVAATNPGWGIAVDAATFALAALVFIPLRGLTAPDRKPAAKSTLITDLRTGWTEFASRAWLWKFVIAWAVINAAWAGSFFILGPVVADDTIGRRTWGLVLAAQTLGGIIGGLIALRLKSRRLLLLGGAMVTFTILPLATLALYPYLWALAGAAFITGVAVQQTMVAWDTTMQEHVPADKLGRVASYDMLGSYAAMPIGQMAVGPIAAVIGTQNTLLGAAGLLAAAVLLVVGSRDVRTLRHTLPDDDVDATPEPVKAR